MTSSIVNVWNDNLESEFCVIRQLIKKYKFISMDTEYPGVVGRPIGIFASSNSYIYQQMRCNVDILKLIQLGITLSDSEGNRPTPCTWQFNFEFNMEKDMFSSESIELLKNANLDFKSHKEKGIDLQNFGDLLTTSGLVLNSDVTWISFHSIYDFAYLVKVMTNTPMAQNELEFKKFMKTIFPNFYDLKVIYPKKGLQEIANVLGIVRDGVMHQAGSDSHLTSMIFWELKKQNEKLYDCKNRLYSIEFVI
ncbi:Poly(A) ribonuclease pop2 [Dictyocoela muelleri]|nr:Poly(A) ribonuclease pop2 [Dictyocoela muelleri]